jgi:hypothetical protein
MANQRAHALAAIVVVALVLALVLRYILHDEPARAPTQADAGKRYARSSEQRPIRALSSGSDVVLGVGDDGVIVRHRAGSAWVADSSPTHATLHAVAQQLDEAIAVGDDGTILELDGSKWSAAASPSKRPLRAVAYTSYGAIAVGDGGTLSRRPAPHEPWRLEPSGTTNDLLGACAGLRDVWIVGVAGTIVFHTSTAWTVHPPLTAATLHAVSCDDHAAIAVGEKGTVLERLDDVGWHETPSNVTADLYAVASPFGARSWLAAGAHGTVVRLSGAASPEPSADWDIRAVTEGALGTWLGGDKGILERVR